MTGSRGGRVDVSGVRFSRWPVGEYVPVPGEAWVFVSRGASRRERECGVIVFLCGRWGWREPGGLCEGNV